MDPGTPSFALPPIVEPRPRGFSLIESMAVFVLLALLLLAAGPSLGTWGAQARIRSTAEALQNGLRLAQAEALHRHRPSAFGLTAAAPDLDAKPIANGPNWFVRLLLLEGSDESDDAQKDPAASRRLIDGGRAASVDITGPALLCFGPLGRPIAARAAATGVGVACELADPAVYVLSSPAAGAWRLQVQVSRGGHVRLCDPARRLGKDEPDGC